MVLTIYYVYRQTNIMTQLILIWYQDYTMSKKPSIFATEAVKGSESIKEFLIYSENYHGGFGINMLELDGIYRFIELNEPQTVTIIGANMHGREIVAFLEYLLSRRYKPLIYELSLKRSPNFDRFVIIKLEKLV